VTIPQDTRSNTDKEHSEGPGIEGWVIVDVYNRGDDVLGRFEVFDLALAKCCLRISVVSGGLEDTIRFLALGDAVLGIGQLTTGVIGSGGHPIGLLLVDNDGVGVLSGIAGPLHGAGWRRRSAQRGTRCG
jgi:hypothetical protein